MLGCGSWERGVEGGGWEFWGGGGGGGGGGGEGCGGGVDFVKKAGGEAWRGVWIERAGRLEWTGWLRDGGGFEEEGGESGMMRW